MQIDLCGVITFRISCTVHLKYQTLSRRIIIDRY